MYNFMDQVVDDDLLEKSSCDQQMIYSEGEDGEPWKLIECEPLAEMLKSGLDKVLLIDSRSFLEYNTSRIQQSVNVCCSKLVKRRLQQDKVQIKDLLTQTCHIDVEEYSDVIVYDQCTALPSILTEDNFLIILLRKLMTCPAFQNVTLLKGGYLAFQAMHPVLCENKNSNSYKCTPLTSLSQPCLPVSNVGPTRILPFLYLGSHRDAMSQETVQVNDISYVLNVSTTCPKPPFIQEGHFFRIPVNDNYSAKMMPFFEEAFQFLDKVREANGCVLVHCLAGISRSPTLAIAYVMKHLNMSSDDAYRYVKDKRPTISPNFNFLGQLLEFERKVGDGEEENNKRVKRDVFCRGNESRHPPASVMDLRSPSSPVAKMSKPFTFDALWPPENLPEATVAGCVKVDANDNMTLTSGLESLSNVRVKEKMSHTKDLNLCSERTSSNSMHISRLGNSVTRESNTNVILSRESASEAYSPSYTCTSPRSFSHCSFSQGLGLTPVSESPSLMTPCSEQPPFPFGGMGSETQGPIPDIPDKENTKNEVRALSTSPRSRSFTLPLSPVTLPLQSMACSLNSPCEGSSSISYTKQDCMITGGKRAFSVASPLSVSPGRKFSKPFTLPLSPVLSPASDKSMSPMDAETSTKKMSKPSELTFSSELRRQQSETFVPSKQDHVISSCSESYSESASSSMSSSMFSSMSVSSSSGSFVMTQNQSMSSSSSSSSSSSKKISKSFHLSLSPVTLPGSDSKASDLCKSNTSESGYQTVNKSTNLPQDSKIENVSSLPSINDQVNSGNNVFTNRSLDNMQKGIVRKRNLSLSLSLSLSNPPQLKSPDDAMETDSSDLSSSDLLPSDGSCESKASRPATLPSALCSPDYEQSIHREKKKHKSWNSDSNCLKNNKNLSASSSLLSSPVSRVQAVASSNIQSPSAALARLHFGQVVQEEQIPSETVTMENKSSAHNFPSTSLDKLNFTPCFAKSASSSPSSLSPSMSMPSSSTAPQFMTSTSSVSSNAIDMSSPSTISSNELVSPSSICSIGSSPPSSAVSSPSSAPSKVILRSKGNRAKKCLVRPASIAFSTYPTCDLGSDCQESPSSGSNTSQDDSSETYMLQNSKRSKPNTEMDSSGHYRYGRYSEREVYKQITAAMESAMLRTQVYEANRKARSLDDILSSEGQESPDVECVCTPFGKLPRRCVERVSSTGLFENMPCRCQGQQELYQSNSSISSSGSHSSLHGSLEIIQGQSAMEESFSAIPVQPPSPNAWIWCPQPP